MLRGVLAQVEQGGFSFGLLVSGFWFGVRHGIDWDHIAAIADITGSQDDRRRAFWLGTLYVLGHALVVFVLGLVAIAAGGLLPERIDEVMGRIVGVTLIVLGVYVFVSLVRHGRDFRLRSRWMLLFSGIRRGSRWVRERVGGSRNHEPGDAELGGGDPSLLHHGHHGRPGHHHHDDPEAHDTFANYTTATAMGVGMIHGVGAETPTQVLIFIAAAGAGGTEVGVAVLLAFIVGLVLSNSLITIGSALGFLSASRNFAVYATVGVLVAVFSLVLGVLFVIGQESVLPAFLAS